MDRSERSAREGSVGLRPDPGARARAAAHHAAPRLLLQIEGPVARGDPAGLLLDPRLARRGEAPVREQEAVVGPLSSSPRASRPRRCWRRGTPSPCSNSAFCMASSMRLGHRHRLRPAGRTPCCRSSRRTITHCALRQVLGAQLHAQAHAGELVLEVLEARALALVVVHHHRQPGLAQIRGQRLRLLDHRARAPRLLPMTTMTTWVGRELRGHDQPRVIRVGHDQAADEPGGDAPGRLPDEVLLPVAPLELVSRRPWRSSAPGCGRCRPAAPSCPASSPRCE